MSDSNSFKDHRSTDYNEVLLCDINGNYKSTKDKLQAHLDGDLHIAFSVQLVRPSKGKQNGIELLLQRRAEGKYHSEGLWTNTCCSHPLINESLEVAIVENIQRDDLNAIEEARGYQRLHDEFGYDHEKIVHYANQRLKWKLEYTNIAKDILASSFRLSQLQGVYETILDKELDKRNFLKKVNKL